VDGGGRPCHPTLPQGYILHLNRQEPSDSWKSHPGREMSLYYARFVETNLDSHRQYCALSYVWGDPNIRAPIMCNETEFLAALNLVSAMKRVRTAETPVTFWIDAICINQDDKIERAAQVQIMQHIYRSAELVIVYLGEEIPGHYEAMTLFSKIWAIGKQVPTSSDNPRVIGFENLEEYGLPPRYDVSWYQLRDFFKRAWFSRVWVIQEVAMAKDDPLVICGAFEIPFSDIVLVTSVLEETHLRHLVAAGDGDCLALNPSRMDWLKPHENSGWHLSISEMLSMTGRFNSTDPRDHVFALLGLALPEELQLLSPFLEISYEKSVKDVYRDLALGYIRCYGRLDILSDMAGPGISSIEELPSWVADWSIPRKNRRTSFSHVVNQGKHYDASLEPVAMVIPTSDPNILRLKCHVFDTVVWVGHFDLNKDLESMAQIRRPRKFQNLWEDVSKRLGATYTNGEQVKDVFWRTLAANTTQRRDPLSEEDYLCFLQFWQLEKCSDADADKFAKESNNNFHDSHTGSFLTDLERRTILDHKDKTTDITYHQEFMGYKNFISLGASMMPCTKDSSGESECPHCSLLSTPERDVREGTIAKLGGHHPALHMGGIDPFMTDYFDMLEDPLPARDLIMANRRDFFYRLHDSLENRAVFITQSGRLGLGPKVMLEGDTVAIFPGSRVPFMVRKTHAAPESVAEIHHNDQYEIAIIHKVSKYILVGDCYVHGAMNGAIVNNGDFEWALRAELLDLV
jgi:hypothetical protein